MSLALDHAERPGAVGQQVDAAVLEFLEDAVDPAGAADVAQTVVGEPDDSELAVPCEALVDHRLVALLEDVQRHDLGWQHGELQREQREL